MIDERFARTPISNPMYNNNLDEDAQPNRRTLIEQEMFVDDMVE